MVTEMRETGSLIGSDKVEGTAVYGAGDTKIGSIERVMIDKMSGKVSYAVLSFGGFQGAGRRIPRGRPRPWRQDLREPAGHPRRQRRQALYRLYPRPRW